MLYFIFILILSYYISAFYKENTALAEFSYIHRIRFRFHQSIPTIQIPGIHLLLHIIQTAVIPVRDNSLTQLFKLLQIIYHSASKERTSILQCRLINNHRCTFRLNTLHPPWIEDWRKLSEFDFIVRR